MTEQEITKAAYWFAKNGNQVDVQHSFEPLERRPSSRVMSRRAI